MFLVEVTCLWVLFGFCLSMVVVVLFAIRGLIGDFETSMFSDSSALNLFVLLERPSLVEGRQSLLSLDRRSSCFSVAILYNLALFRRSWCWETAVAVVLLISIMVGYLFFVWIMGYGLTI